MFWREPDFLTLRRQNSASACATANRGSNGRTFSATSESANCGSNACATADDGGIAFLR
jgi:hypothetical protein